MAGYSVTGRGDLDALFMARVNAKRADVGFYIGSTDISNRYEPIGTGTPIAATGFQYAGTDLASLFRNINQPLGTHTLTAATSGNFTGFSKGSFGSITPAAFNGVNVYGLYDVASTGQRTFAMENASLAVNWLTSITCNGSTVYTADRINFIHGSVSSSWVFAGHWGLANGVVYPVILA